jgi:hypothetical protein
MERRASLPGSTRVGSAYGRSASHVRLPTHPTRDVIRRGVTVEKQFHRRAKELGYEVKKVEPVIAT